MDQRPRHSPVRACSRRCHATPPSPACANRGRGGNERTVVPSRQAMPRWSLFPHDAGQAAHGGSLRGAGADRHASRPNGAATVLPSHLHWDSDPISAHAREPQILRGHDPVRRAKAPHPSGG